MSGNIGKYPNRHEPGDADGDRQIGKGSGWTVLPNMNMRPIGPAPD
jgi:hypothetical protein